MKSSLQRPNRFSFQSTASAAKLRIAGYYHANENFRDTSVDVFSQRIADRIANAAADSTSSSSVLVTLDNRRLGLNMEQHALIASAHTDGKWKKSPAVRVEEGAVEAANELLQRRVQDAIVDFDNHLDDLNKDYLNVELNMEIDQCL